MKRKLIQSVAVVAGAAVAAAANASPLSSRFTYQGRLTHGGELVDMNVDITARLYDAPMGGVLLGSQAFSSIDVVDGLFAVDLNANGEFGANAFDGAGRWLEIQVNGATLSPRQTLAATPYALGLRPGAEVSGDFNNAGVFNVTNSNQAVVGDSSAVRGAMTGANGSGHGVFGETSQGTGSGVYGKSTAGAGVGVRGYAFGNSGRGVFGASNSIVGATIGVYGQDVSVAGTGVYGSSLAASGAPVGVRGSVNSPTGYAGYFTGGRNFFDGPVGIGETAPTFKLDVTTLNNDVARFSTSHSFGSVLALVSNGGGRNWSMVSTGSAHSSGPGNLVIRDVNGFADRMILSATGKVGIGTNTPAQPLSVAGVIESTSGGFKFPDGSVQTAAASLNSLWNASGNHISNANAGNVGIGTSSPARLLHLASAANPELRIEDISSGGKTFHIGISSADDSLRIAESGVADRITISAAGNIGLNTTSPTAPLSVRSKNIAPGFDVALSLRDASDTHKWELALDDGNLYFGSPGGGQFSVTPNGRGFFDGGLNVIGTTTTDVLTIMGGSDIAEPYNVNETTDLPSEPGLRDGVRPGMVVSIDPQSVGELRIADIAYDTKVAGIISGAGGVNVGLTLTQKGSVADGKHPVAMTGRVWCWCDADAGGSVRAGDLLTTSTTAGHAMKVADRERAGGSTIGKAMSSLETGRGLVLVLVNLQ